MRKRVLITAGNTRVPIDKVRGIDNIFRGRTGAQIAHYFANQGYEVVLLTSHPEGVSPHSNLDIHSFNTFDQLNESMCTLVMERLFHVIVHSAAVSDYKPVGIYQQVGDPVESDGGLLRNLQKLDSTGKVGSNHSELWMRLTPTIKIVDQIRQPWGFKGTLVKFKLQVGMSDTDLIDVATRSMKHSQADFVVANTLEGLNSRAFIISAKKQCAISVSRTELPAKLLAAIEAQ